MKCRILLLLIAYAIIAYTKAYSSVFINGRIDSAGLKKVYLTNRGNSSNNLFVRKIFDSCVAAKDGSFHFVIPRVDEGQYYSIELSTISVGWIPLLPKDDEIIDIKSVLSTYIINRIVSGCKECLLEDTVNILEEPIIDQINTYADSASFYRSKYDSDSADYYSHENQRIMNSLLIGEKTFIRSHPLSLLSLQLLRRNRTKLERDTIKDLLSGLDSSLHKVSLYQTLLDFSSTQQIKTGKTPINIPITDSQNRQTTFLFSSYKGKTILIDFWASWCKPCRENIPAMKEVFSSLNKIKYDFVSISIDNEQADWKEALKKEEMPWLNYIMSAKDRDKFMNLYSLTSIPKYILITPGGDISIIANDFKTIELKLKQAD